MYFLILSPGMQGQWDPESVMVSLSDQIGELLVQWESLPKKIRCRDMEKDTRFLSLVFTMHMDK